MIKTKEIELENKKKVTILVVNDLDASSGSLAIVSSSLNSIRSPIVLVDDFPAIVKIPSIPEIQIVETLEVIEQREKKNKPWEIPHYLRKKKKHDRNRR